MGPRGTDLVRQSAFEKVSQDVLGLLNKCVLEASRPLNGTLSLTFDDDNFSELYDDSASYDSYTISSSV